MKKASFLFTFGTAGLLLGLGTSRLAGQTVGDPIAVPVHIDLTESYDIYDDDLSHTVILQGEPPTPTGTEADGLFDLQGNDVSGGALLQPDKPYLVSVVDGDGVTASNFSVSAPPGYTVEIDGAPMGTVNTTGGGGYTLTIASNRQTRVARSGVASSFSKDRVYWQVSLGSLQDGSSAGWLSINNMGYSSDLSALFTPAALQYTPPSSSEIQVYDDIYTGSVSQILTHDALINVVIPSGSTNSYELDFYPASAAVGSTIPYTFSSGAKYVSYLISEGSNASQITITSTTYASGTAVRTALTSLTRTGSGWPYHWSLADWYTSATTPLVSVEVANAGSTSGSTPEVSTVENESSSPNLVATTTTKQYTQFDWGCELTSEIRGSNTSTQDQSTYAYYTDSSVPNSYGFIQSSYDNGHWTAYEYLSPSGGTYNGNDGIIYKIHRQYLNSSTTLPSDISADTSGAITTCAYTTDFWGVYSKPTSIVTMYGTDTLENVSIAYDGFTDWLPLNGMPTVVTTRADYANGSSTLHSSTCYYREDIVDEFFASKLCSSTHANGTKDSYAYQRGALASGVPTFNGILYGAGDYSRVLAIHGAAASSTGATAWTSPDSGAYALDSAVYLVPNKSTMDVTIRDPSAHVTHTETDVWTGSIWTAVQSVDYTYDATNNELLTRTANNGASATYAYSGEQLASQTDQADVATSYAYDYSGRVYSTTKTTHASGNLASLTTTIGHDAANHVTQEVVGGSIISGTGYDDAGRVTSTTDPNAGTTSYAYSPSTWTTTVTLPNGGSRVDVTCPDGHLSSETGSGVVPRYFTYAVNAAGNLTTTVNYSTSTSSRFESTTIDVLGRTVSTVQPTFGSTSATYTVQNNYNSTTGLLAETSRSVTGGPSLANIFYQYDAMAQCNRQGLDIDGSGALETNSASDRITDTNQDIESDGTNWWKTTKTTIYPTASSSTGLVTSIVQDRLTGWSGSVVADRKVTDSYGTVTETTATVNPGASTVTTATINPGFSSSSPATVVSVAGLTTSQNGFDGLVTTVGYDGQWRPITQTDSRSNAITTTYVSGTTLVASTADATGDTVATYNYDTAGRVTTSTDANGKYTYLNYDNMNHVTQQWGDVPFSASYGYDVYGECTSMSTWHTATAYNPGLSWWGSSPTSTTNWTYDAETGLLANKTDSAGNSVVYTYNTFGQTLTRTWARGTVSTYGYSASTDELTGITYSDSTPAVAYTYTRSGQLSTASDATTAGDSGSRTFHYDNTSNPLQLTAEHLDGAFYGGRWLSQVYDVSSGVGATGGYYDSYTAAAVNGRPDGFEIGSSESTAGDLYQQYTRTSGGQFVGVHTQTAGAPYRDLVYTYAASSNLVAGFTDETGGNFSTSQSYEPHRNLLTSVQGKWGSTIATEFDYVHNVAYQTKSVAQSGTAFSNYDGASGNTFRLMTYDAHGELTSDIGYLGSDTTNLSTPLRDRNFAYVYDAIGNRTSSNYTGSSSLNETYTANNLNEYTARDNLSVPVSGFAKPDGSVKVTLGVSSSLSSTTTSTTLAGQQGGFWAGEALPPVASSGSPAAVNSSGPAALNLLVTAGDTAAGTQYITTPTLTIAKQSQSFGYDADGNLTSDGMWSYTYDAENRVTLMQQATITGAPHCYTLTFTYDYMGRRVEKDVSDSVTGIATAHRFAYNGWNLIADYQVSSGLQLYRTFTWGLDVTGSLSAAGGVGALMELTNVSWSGGTATTADYFPTYDGNGNIASLIPASSGTGAAAAVYEYSSFGEPLQAQGVNLDATVTDNPFRFSTKFTDTESGLIYYGNRFYSPTFGRFINRDPIGEAGGINLYGFVTNNPANSFDVLGDSAASAAAWTASSTANSISMSDNEQQTEAYAEGAGTASVLAGIASGSIQVQAANSDLAGEADATGTQQMVNEANQTAAANPTATGVPATTVSGGWQNGILGAIGEYDADGNLVKGYVYDYSTGTWSNVMASDDGSAPNSGMSAASAAIIASLGPGDLAKIPYTYSTDSILLVVGPDGSMSIPTAPIKDYQAGLLGSGNTPIIVPPGTDPNQFVWAGQYVANNSPIPGGASTTIFSMFNPIFGYNPKTNGIQYDQWGNVAFGLTGAEAGLSSGELQSGGVLGQVMVHGSFSNPPANQAAIQTGFNLAGAVNSGSTLMLFNLP